VPGRAAVEPGSLGMLTRSARQRDIVAQGLRDRGISARVVASQDLGRADAPRLMTMHRAKGLEFSRVVLFGIDRNSVPSQRSLAEESADEQVDRLARERFLLYVAGTWPGFAMSLRAGRSGLRTGAGGRADGPVSGRCLAATCPSARRRLPRPLQLVSGIAPRATWHSGVVSWS
jgi:hypothetical protein